MTETNRSRLLTWVLLGLILLLGATVRFWRIDAAPFWRDEHLTVELSNGHGLAHLDLPRGQIISPVPDLISLEQARPMYDIWVNSSRDVHPPLFYMVLRIWREIFGESDTTIRGLSAVLSILAIIALFLAVEAQAGATPALWASLLMAVSAVQIEFAQEARSYMLLEACLLGACAALTRIERYGPTPRRLIALGVLFFAAAMTHLLALPLLGAMGIYALIAMRDRPRNLAVGAMLIAGAAFVLIWGPFAWAQSGGYLSRTEFVLDSRWSLQRWFVRVAGLPLKQFVAAPTRSAVVASMGAVLYVLPLLLLRTRPALLLWWLWLTLGVFSVAMADLVRQGEMLSFARYTVAASPGAFVLAAMMLAHLEGWFRHIVPMLLSLACLAAIQGAYIRLNANWRGLSSAVERYVGEDDVLVMLDSEPDGWEVRCNVVGIQYYARTSPAAVALLDGPPGPQLQDRFQTGRPAWVFTPVGNEYGAMTIFPGAKIVDIFPFDQIGTLVKVEQSPQAGSTEPASPAPP